MELWYLLVNDPEIPRDGLNVRGQRVQYQLLLFRKYKSSYSRSVGRSHLSLTLGWEGVAASDLQQAQQYSLWCFLWWIDVEEHKTVKKNTLYKVWGLSVVSCSGGLFVCFFDLFCNALVYFIFLIIAWIAGQSHCLHYHHSINFEYDLFRVQHLQEFIPGLLALTACRSDLQSIASLISCACWPDNEGRIPLKGSPVLISLFYPSLCSG